jgi:hypothetical protein
MVDATRQSMPIKGSGERRRDGRTLQHFQGSSSGLWISGVKVKRILIDKGGAYNQTEF